MDVHLSTSSLEAWLRWSHCSKIFQYFLSSFILIKSQLFLPIIWLLSALITLGIHQTFLVNKLQQHKAKCSYIRSIFNCLNTIHNEFECFAAVSGSLQQVFSLWTFWLVTVGKTQLSLMTLTMALFYSSVPKCQIALNPFCTCFNQFFNILCIQTVKQKGQK